MDWLSVAGSAAVAVALSAPASGLLAAGGEAPAASWASVPCSAGSGSSAAGVKGALVFSAAAVAAGATKGVGSAGWGGKGVSDMEGSGGGWPCIRAMGLGTERREQQRAKKELPWCGLWPPAAGRTNSPPAHVPCQAGRSWRRQIRRLSSLALDLPSNPAHSRCQPAPKPACDPCNPAPTLTAWRPGKGRGGQDRPPIPAPRVAGG
jgi:hypothetical protein